MTNVAILVFFKCAKKMDLVHNINNKNLKYVRGQNSHEYGSMKILVLMITSQRCLKSMRMFEFI